MNDQQFLNQIERDLVTQFYENTPLREAVKKVLLSTIYTCGVMSPGDPTKALDFTSNPVLATIINNLAEPNEVLAPNLRALAQGLNALEVAFNRLEEYKKVEPKDPPKPNKAR